jgi:hypothetical protein
VRASIEPKTHGGTIWRTQSGKPAARLKSTLVAARNPSACTNGTGPARLQAKTREPRRRAAGVKTSGENGRKTISLAVPLREKTEPPTAAGRANPGRIWRRETEQQQHDLRENSIRKNGGAAVSGGARTRAATHLRGKRESGEDTSRERKNREPPGGAEP